MIYTYIALGTLSLYALVATGAYMEEKRAHKRTFIEAKKIIREQEEILSEFEAENNRLACVARAYKTLAFSKPEK